MRRILAFLFIIVWLPGCKSNVEPEKEEARPASVQEQPAVVEELPPAADEEAETQQDRGPDGGLGTLDYSRDAKAASEEQSKQAEKALEETE